MELNYEKYKIKKIFINFLLKKGKKIKSEKLFKKILINLKYITKKNPNIILEQAINNLLPKIKIIELKKKKWNKKKKNYFLFFLNKNKQIKISIKWLFINSNLKKISKEIIQTYKKKSKTIKFKKNYYKEIKKLKFNLNL